MRLKISSEIEFFQSLGPQAFRSFLSCKIPRVWKPPFGLTIYRAPNPETPKNLKKSPKRSLGPQTLDPQKVPKESEKSTTVSGGPKLLLGDFFETFRDFEVLGSVEGRQDRNS